MSHCMLHACVYNKHECLAEFTFGSFIKINELLVDHHIFSTHAYQAYRNKVNCHSQSNTISTEDFRNLCITPCLCTFYIRIYFLCASCETE